MPAGFFFRPGMRKIAPMDNPPVLRLLGAVLLACALGMLAALAATDLDRLQELAQTRYGTHVARQIADWRGELAQVQGHSDEVKLSRINHFFNHRIRWVEDTELWLQDDYWATLLETMAKGAGDCEDFVIAKYVSLLIAGVDERKLRLTYVRLQQQPDAPPIAHMILAYYPAPGAEPLILDNVYKDIRAASLRPDLTPVYSFNATQLWFRGPDASVDDPTARISRWRDVLTRLQAEHTL